MHTDVCVYIYMYMYIYEWKKHEYNKNYYINKLLFKKNRHTNILADIWYAQKLIRAL